MPSSVNVALLQALGMRTLSFTSINNSFIGLGNRDSLAPTPVSAVVLGLGFLDTWS